MTRAVHLRAEPLPLTRIRGVYQHVTCAWGLVPDDEKAVYVAVQRLVQNAQSEEG